LQNLLALKQQVKQLALDHGFQQATISDIDTSNYFSRFQQWVNEGNHGNMSFLERNQKLRQDPNELHPNTCRVISVRYNYLPDSVSFTKPLNDPNTAYISRYALGRDYHKLMRKKLQKLAESIRINCEEIDYRVFVDSAPVLETAFAEKSGLGWKGKHTLIINKDAGSWFFLGEIFINLPLEIDAPTANQCGSCSACINLCPTDAIVAPYKVDARRCISYLTIENDAEIPVELRPKMGNRIYGCDDCQLACPWNRYSSTTNDGDFSPRHNLDQTSLLSLFNWTKQEFDQKLQGNPIRRIGYEKWQRNIAVALGNGEFNDNVINALERKKENASLMVKEHIEWAINQLNNAGKGGYTIPEKTKKLIRSIKKMMPQDF